MTARRDSIVFSTMVMAEGGKKKKEKIIIIVGVTPEGTRRNKVRPHPTVALSYNTFIFFCNIQMFIVVYNNMYSLHTSIERSEKQLDRG